MYQWRGHIKMDAIKIRENICFIDPYKTETGVDKVYQ